MYNTLDKFLQIKESLIDFAQPDLDKQIWQKTDQGYTLVKGVSQKIYEFIQKFPEADLISMIQEIRIVGSLTSNQYLPDTDLDVHIVPINLKDWDEKKVQYTKKWFDKNQEKFDAYIGEHPIEIYVQLNLSQDFLSPGLYNLKTHKWEKGPKIVPSNYDPYEDYSDIMGELKNSVRNADIILGELKRDVIDYEIIQKATQKMSSEDKKHFLEKLELKLKEIEDDINKLYAERKEWVMARRVSTIAPVTPEKALEDTQLAKQWRDANSLFKFISRYQYLKVIKDLKDTISDDGELDTEELDSIKKIAGVQ